MRNVWIAPVFLISAVLGISPDASAQSASTPDLSGVWAPAANLDHFSTEEPSFTPWAAERYRAAREGTTRPLEQGREDVDPMLHPYCMVPGYPRIYIRPSPIEIGHTSDRVYVLFEVNNQWRIIYMDGRTHPESAPPTFMGHSVGRWDGDTLVSETVGLNELTWLDSLGTPHSDVLRVEERIRRVAHDRLEMDFLFEDSKAFTRPWRGERNWELRPDWQLMEYGICNTPATILYEDELLEGKIGQ